MKKLNESSQFLFKSYVLRENPIINKIIIKKYGSPLQYYKSAQNGGNNTICINYNNESFDFHEFEENYWALYAKDGRDCVTVGIDPEHHEAYINNINADTTKCGHTILTNQGSHLFKITLQFLKDNKDRFKIRKITITDHAKKFCPSSEDNIDLGVFLTLLTGHTWYGKYGFRPVREYNNKKYMRNHDIMKTAKIRDINFDIILAELKENSTKEEYAYFIKKYNQMKDSNPRIKDMLKMIFAKTNFNFICSIFDKIKDKLILMLELQFDNQVKYSLNI